MISRQSPWRSKKYTAWVKRQNCIVTRGQADDPHHIIGHGFGGMGTKAPDWAVIPLQRWVHRELHSNAKEWERLHGCQLDLLMQFWRENWDEIREFFNGK